jgi:hypothetical protein
MALVGAYMMAGALATHADPSLAFRTHEAATRPYVLVNQRLVKDGSTMIAPDSSLELWARNSMIRLAPLLSSLGMPPRAKREAYEALVLPDFNPPLRGRATRSLSSEWFGANVTSGADTSAACRMIGLGKNGLCPFSPLLS